MQPRRERAGGKMSEEKPVRFRITLEPQCSTCKGILLSLTELVEPRLVGKHSSDIRFEHLEILKVEVLPEHYLKEDGSVA